MFGKLFKLNFKLKLWTWWTIPLLAMTGAKVIYLDDKSIKVKIKLKWLTKNHLGSMYLGAQAIGADLTGGGLLLNAIERTGKKVSVAFKDMQCEFLKRPEGDVIFLCNDGELIDKMMLETYETGERVNKPVKVEARVPSISDELVSRFTLTLSVKYKS